ncbi:MAG TPA: hypothetical protein VNX21_00615 [Candidatus Thermoplasmatota archaeon]|nr:hypothetical protein [Candidatus Thermoplasmatota archaeon]
MLALVAAVPGALGADPFVARGKFLAGDPFAYSIMDACGNAAQEGIDSSCVKLPNGASSKHYILRATDDSGTLIAASACFYTADFGWSQCDPWNQRVPAWAAYVSISALGGLNVHWTYIVEM